MACALWPAVAPGQVPRLLVLPVGAGEGVPPKAAGRLDALLVQELQTREGELTVLSPPPPAAAQPAPSAEAARELALGKRLVAEQRFAQAAVALRKGIALALEAPLGADFPAVVDAHVLLGVALFRQGDDKGAQAALAQAIRLQPDLRVTRYPPVFLREVEKARARVERAGQGELVVDGPAGAKVALDGREVGTTPAKVAGVPHGLHYVTLKAPDGRAAAVEVEVGPAPVRVFVTVPPGASTPQVPLQLTAAEAASIARYATELGASHALAVVLDGRDGKLWARGALYGAAPGGWVRLADQAIGADLANANVAALRLGDEVAARLRDFGPLQPLPLDLSSPPRAAPLAAAPDLTGPPVAPAKAGPGLFAKVPWWVWAATGVVVVGGVTAGAVVYANRPVTGTMTARW